jgi:hypothetical protein
VPDRQRNDLWVSGATKSAASREEEAERKRLPPGVDPLAIDQVSQNGWLLSRRGRSLPANASDVDTHRDSISSRSDCRSPA